MGGYDNGGYQADHKDQNYNVKGAGGGGGSSFHPSQLTDEEVRREKFRIMKNVILISVSFLLLFTAFQSMANLQSSINKVTKKQGFTNMILSGW